MVICLPQQRAVVCAAHGEAGGGAAVAEGERRIARTEGCNIGEGEGGSAAFCRRGFGWHCRRRWPGADKDIDKWGGFWYSTKVPCANDTRWCGAMAAQLICNQWVAGSTPVTSSKKSYDIPLKSGVCRGAFTFMSPTASPPFRKIMPPGGARVLKSAHHAIIIGSAKQRTSK